MSKPKIDVLVHSADSYKRFKKKFPSETITKKLFSEIIYDAGKIHSEHILNGHSIKLPNRLGEMLIEEKELAIKSYSGKIILPINWKETLKLGKRVYHTNPDTNSYFQVRWLYFKVNGMRDFWNFAPSRVHLQRKIKDASKITKYFRKIK